jgi:dihydrofolate synthase/folylpolyglutamate synthase
MDHMQYLGNRLEDIAFEKCGIIKENGTVVSAIQEENVYEVIEDICNIKNASFTKATNNKLELLDFNINGQKFIYTYNNEEYELNTTLIGTYQIINIQTALAVIMELRNKGINIGDNSIKDGVSKSKWPGRLEVMSKNPIIVLDGAHNESGINYLKTSIEKYFGERKKVLILGILEDKQYEVMIRNISGIFEKIIVTQPQNERKLNVEKIKSVVKLYNNNVEGYIDYREAIDKAIDVAKSEDLICIAGSLYLIGIARKYLKESKL